MTEQERADKALKVAKLVEARYRGKDEIKFGSSVWEFVTLAREVVAAGKKQTQLERSSLKAAGIIGTSMRGRLPQEWTLEEQASVADIIAEECAKAQPPQPEQLEIKPGNTCVFLCPYCNHGFVDQRMRCDILLQCPGCGGWIDLKNAAETFNPEKQSQSEESTKAIAEVLRVDTPEQPEPEPAKWAMDAAMATLRWGPITVDKIARIIERAAAEHYAAVGAVLRRHFVCLELRSDCDCCQTCLCLYHATEAALKLFPEEVTDGE